MCEGIGEYGGDAISSTKLMYDISSSFFICSLGSVAVVRKDEGIYMHTGRRCVLRWTWGRETDQLAVLDMVHLQLAVFLR